MSNIFSTTLGNLIEFQRGYDLPKLDFNPGTVPVISSNGILGYHDEYKVIGPGITIGRSGTVGLPHFINENFFPHNTSLFVKDFKGNDPRYIFYLLKTLGLQNQKSGSSVPTMNRNHLHPLKVLVYLNIEIQQKIAFVLSTLDAKIELNNQINAELESLAKTIYDYWFVQFDFPYDFDRSQPDEHGKPYKSSGGEMVWSDTLDRSIPAGWEVGIAADLFTFNPTLSLAKGTMSGYIDMNAISTSGFMTGDVEYKEYNGGMKFSNGDVVMARITPCLENGKTGLITLLNEDEVGFGSTEFIVIRGKNRSLSSFAACLARSDNFRNFAISNMTGTSGRKRVDAKIVETFSMPIPEDSLLSKFENLVIKYFQLSTINTKQNQELIQLRDWLLPMLMNGQVRVK